MEPLLTSFTSPGCAVSASNMTPTIVTFLDRIVDGSREALTLVLLTIGMRRQQQLHDIEGGIH